MAEVQTETQEGQAAAGQAEGQEAGGGSAASRDADYANMQRAYNEMQEGKRLPQALQDKGYGSLDDIPAKDEVPARRSDPHDRSGDRGRVAKAADGEPFDRDPATGRPLRPRRDDFRDDVGDLDEDAYEDAREVREAALRAWEREQEKRADADEAEERAAHGFVSGDPAKSLVAAFDGNAGQVKDCVLALAAGIAGSDHPATPEQVVEAGRMLEGAFRRYTNAHAQEALDEAQRAASGEGTSVASGEGGRTSTAGGEGGGENESPADYYQRQVNDLAAARKR